MTTQRTTDITDTTGTEADERSVVADAWLPGLTRDEIESAERQREPRPLVDYFERMRERGLLD